MNKIYKIGRYFYKEIAEEEYCELRQEVEKIPKRYYSTVFTLTDIDGEPIKFFKKVKNEVLS